MGAELEARDRTTVPQEQLDWYGTERMRPVSDLIDDCLEAIGRLPRENFHSATQSKKDEIPKDPRLASTYWGIINTPQAGRIRIDVHRVNQGYVYTGQRPKPGERRQITATFLDPILEPYKAVISLSEFPHPSRQGAYFEWREKEVKVDGDRRTENTRILARYSHGEESMLQAQMILELLQQAGVSPNSTHQ